MAHFSVSTLYGTVQNILGHTKSHLCRVSQIHVQVTLNVAPHCSFSLILSMFNLRLYFQLYTQYVQCETVQLYTQYVQWGCIFSYILSMFKVRLYFQLYTQYIQCEIVFSVIYSVC